MQEGFLTWEALKSEPERRKMLALGERSGPQRGAPVQGPPGCLDCPVSGRRWGIRPGSEPPSGRRVLARAPELAPGSSVLLSAPSGPRRSRNHGSVLFLAPSHLWGSGSHPPAPHPGASFSRSSANETDKLLQTPGTARGGPRRDWKGASGLRSARRRYRRCFCERNAAWPWLSVALNQCSL